MTILSPAIPPPPWFYRATERALGLVQLLQCACGFTYVARASKPAPERCLGCHHASMRKPGGRRASRRVRPGYDRRVA